MWKGSVKPLAAIAAGGVFACYPALVSLAARFLSVNEIVDAEDGYVL